MYKIYDTHKRDYTRGIYKTLRTATHQADRLDLKYGGYRYIVVPLSEVLNMRVGEISEKSLTL